MRSVGRHRPVSVVRAEPTRAPGAGHSQTRFADLSLVVTRDPTHPRDEEGERRELERDGGHVLAQDAPPLG